MKKRLTNKYMRLKIQNEILLYVVRLSIVIYLGAVTYISYETKILMDSTKTLNLKNY